MVTDKEVKLVDQLLDKTRRHSITWEPSAKDDEFISTVSFTVDARHDTEILTMRDELDRVLLTVGSDSIPKVSELYAEARRFALKVDESLDEVLDQLERMGAADARG